MSFLLRQFSLTPDPGLLATTRCLTMHAIPYYRCRRSRSREISSDDLSPPFSFPAVRLDAQYSSEVTSTWREYADLNGIVDMDAIRHAPAQAQAASRVPTLLKFPLLVGTTFALSSLLYTLAADFTGPELASVSRDLTAGWHIATIVGWKLVELGIAWYMRFDCKWSGSLPSGYNVHNG